MHSPNFKGSLVVWKNGIRAIARCGDNSDEKKVVEKTNHGVPENQGQSYHLSRKVSLNVESDKIETFSAGRTGLVFPVNIICAVVMKFRCFLLPHQLNL